MQTDKGSISLIGMPGAGKSTIGAMIAERIQRPFIDTDLVIEAEHGGSLQAVLDSGDYLKFRADEERAVCSLDCGNAVVSTGGSVVYSDNAMKHLAAQSTIVYLQLELDTLLHRLGDVSQRGLLRKPGQSIEDLFVERSPLYVKWADIVFDCNDLSADSVVEGIIHALM
ncbi:MAG: shikimate kinase [Pseudomonadales bacterium]